MVEFRPDVRYAYYTGRIRALETKLLSSFRVEKMIGSSSISDALIYLENTAYDDTIGEIKEPEEYPGFVKKEKETIFDLMEQLIPDTDVKQLFKITYDFHNIKTLLKGRFSEKDTFSSLSEFGTVSCGLLKETFQTDNFNPLPDFMKEVIGEAMANYYLTKDLKSMEFLIDNLEFRYLYSKAVKTETPFLVNYVRIKIDLINISTFLRIKHFDTGNSLKEILLENGHLPIKFFLNLSGETMESIPGFFRNTPYHRVLELGVKKILEDGSFQALDRENENFIMDYMKLTRYVTFGIEPIFAYFISREQDLNIIKMILVGKLNEISAKEIKERIPITFN